MADQRGIQIIEKAARKHGINPAILFGLWGAETGFRAPGVRGADSPAGARGPFQFMPATAQGYGIDPENFAQAANAAAKYLATYKDRGVRGMLAAYNAGPAGNPNNPETAAYVPKVLQLAKQYQGTGTLPGRQAKGQGNGASVPQGGATQTKITYDLGSTGKLTPGTQPSIDYSRAMVDALMQGGRGLKQVGQDGVLQRAMQLVGTGQYTTEGTPTTSVLPQAPTAKAKTVQTGGQAAPVPVGGTAPRKPVKGAQPGSPIVGGTHGGEHGTSGLPGYSGVDYFAPAGSTAVAPVSGKVIRLSGRTPKAGAYQGAGGPLGWSVYIKGDDGHTYYMTHMGKRTVKVGQRVKQGQRVGTVANYHKYGRQDHIHMGRQ